jgi:hypothetical protein
VPLRYLGELFWSYTIRRIVPLQFDELVSYLSVRRYCMATFGASSAGYKSCGIDIREQPCLFTAPREPA